MYRKLLNKKLEEKEEQDKKLLEIEEKNNKQLELNKKKKEEEYAKRYSLFTDFLEKLEKNDTDRKSILSLFKNNYMDKSDSNNNEGYVLTSFHGIEIAAKPKNIQKIMAYSGNKNFFYRDNKFYIGIELVPQINSISGIIWKIYNKELCSFPTKFNNIEPEEFHIPRTIYFNTIKKNKVKVNKDVIRYNLDRYYYAIEIDFDDIENAYIFKSIDNQIIPGPNCSDFHFASMSTDQDGEIKKLNIKIKEDVFLNNKQTIIDDLLRIFIGNTKDNEILKYTFCKKDYFILKPFEISKEFWDKPYSSLYGNIINDYPRYIAHKLQSKDDVKNLSKHYFEYLIEN